VGNPFLCRCCCCSSPSYVVGLPSKVWRASEGVAALTEDFRVESKLIPRRKARSMLFRMRCAGLLETALDLSDWEAVFCDRARTNAGGTAAAVVGGLEGAEALILIVESGLPPIGKSGSRLCFMRLGAENCLLSSSSFTCLISGCCDPPPFPSDSGPVEAGACVLPISSPSYGSVAGI